MLPTQELCIPVITFGWLLQVFDGVTIGFPVSMCHMIRPWELPNNLDYLRSIDAVHGHPAKLCDGCDVDSYTMIPSSAERLTLWQLAEGKSVSGSCHSALIEWLWRNRPEIMPYIKTICGGSQRYTLIDSDGDYKLIWRVLAHWGCPDPELKLISPLVFKAVNDIIVADGKFDSELMQPINLYADGLNLLITYDGRVHPNLAKEGKLSPQLLSLLKRSLDIAQSSIQDKAEHRTDSNGDPVAVTQPYLRWQHFETEFEEFVKTGVFSPSHPAMRTFPYFRQDYLACMSQTRRESKRNEDRKSAQDILRQQSERFGANCNKYKARTRALTPGLFTVFCGSCGVCEYLELMPRFESPVIAFRVFGHRAWREDDHLVMKQFDKFGLWDDCI